MPSRSAGGVQAEKWEGLWTEQLAAVKPKERPELLAVMPRILAMEGPRRWMMMREDKKKKGKMVKDGVSRRDMEGLSWMWTWSRFCFCCCITCVPKSTRYRVHADVGRKVGIVDTNIKEYYTEMSKQRAVLHLQAFRRGIKARGEVERVRVEMRDRIVARQAAKRRADLHWLCVRTTAKWIMLHHRAACRLRRADAAAVLLQTVARMVPDREVYHERRRQQREMQLLMMRHSAALVVQAGWRATHARLWIIQCEQAIIKLQASWRGHVLRVHRHANLRLGGLAVAMACHGFVEARPFAKPGTRYIGDHLNPHKTMIWKVAALLLDRAAHSYAWAVTPHVINIQRCCRGMAGRARVSQLVDHKAAVTLQTVVRVMLPQYERLRRRRLRALRVLQRFYKRRLVMRLWASTDPMMYLRHVRCVLRLQRAFRAKRQAAADELSARRKLFKLAKLLKRVGLVPRIAAYNRLPLDMEEAAERVVAEAAPLLNFSHPAFNPLLELDPTLPTKLVRLQNIREVQQEAVRWGTATRATALNQWRQSSRVPEPVRGTVEDVDAGLAGQIVPATTSRRLFEIHDRSELAHWKAALPPAAAAGDLERVQQTLAWYEANGVTNEFLEQQDDRGRSPFWLALFNGHWEIAMLLLDCGADSELRDAEHVTPFFQACRIGNLALAQWLHVHRRANIYAAPFSGPDAFIAACEQGWFPLVQYFVETVGLPPDYASPVSDGPGPAAATIPPFYAAAAAGHLQLCEYLHRCGFDTLTGPAIAADPPRMSTSAAVSEVSDPFSLAEEQLAVLGDLFAPLGIDDLVKADNPGIPALDAAVAGGHDDVVDFLQRVHHKGKYARNGCPAMRREQLSEYTPLPDRTSLLSRLSLSTAGGPPAPPIAPPGMPPLSREHLAEAPGAHIGALLVSVAAARPKYLSELLAPEAHILQYESPPSTPTRSAKKARRPRSAGSVTSTGTSGPRPASAGNLSVASVASSVKKSRARSRKDGKRLQTTTPKKMKDGEVILTPNKAQRFRKARAAENGSKRRGGKMLGEAPPLRPPTTLALTDAAVVATIAAAAGPRLP